MKTYEIFTITHSFTIQAGNPMAAITKAINEKDFNIMNVVAIVEHERGQEFITGEKQCNLPVVTPRLFHVVANNDRDNWEQITNGLTLERAKAYKQNDFCKNNWPNAFIVCTFNEG